MANYPSHWHLLTIVSQDGFSHGKNATLLNGIFVNLGVCFVAYASFHIGSGN